MSSWWEISVAAASVLSGLAGGGAVLWRFAGRLFQALESLRELEEIKVELQGIKTESAATRQNTATTNGKLAEALVRLAVVETRVADHIHDGRGTVRLTRDPRANRQH